MKDVQDVLRRELSAEQLEAATDSAAEVLTLACAGSGKSRTLAFRIAWLLHDQGASPDEIVAFTFTDKAAESIKLRVAHALAAVGLDPNIIGRMYIGTIHSYCQFVLGQMDAKYRQFDVLDGNRLKLYLMENYPRLGLKVLRDSRDVKRYFVVIESFQNAWSQFNEELMSVSDLNEYDPDLGRSIESLHKALIDDQFLDFSLMQRLVVDALAAEDSRAAGVVSRLKHLLVDEYQDINPIQDSLIRSLHLKGRSLFVVGDDDQSIYGWRGADVTRIQTFVERFPGSTRHTLSTNYRSTPLIVNAADRFAHEELGAQRIEKNPQAFETSSPHEFRNLWFGTRGAEASWISAKIEELLGKAYDDSGSVRGLTPADFAILMQSTRTAETRSTDPRHQAYTEALGDIPFSLESGGGLFERPHVEVLRAAFELFRDGQPTRQVVEDFFGSQVSAVYPCADVGKLYALYAKWGRDIHSPVAQGAPRRRIYPQNLVFGLLEAFDLRSSQFDDGVVKDIGVFSKIIQDVEAVYPSVDSTDRFTSILNFLSVVAESGYDTSSSEIVTRPDAVTVSTVHKMKGLEFPVVFVVDVEARRFPRSKRRYDGWLPKELMDSALQRGAYQSTYEEQARLFYTALTRAERFLYVTGSENGPGGGQPRKASAFVAHLIADDISTDPVAPTANLRDEQPRRRVEASNLPTSYSDIRYYLRCPKDYQFRKVFGFSPAVPDLFGFGNTVHAGIGKLHELFPNTAPTPSQAEEIADDIFHLKHVMQSGAPKSRPGPYERAKERAKELTSTYVENFSTDFEQRRQLEARFEIPVDEAVVSGAIDLMIEEDEEGRVLDACVVDFKTIFGGEDAVNSENLNWTELALQVQLYAKAAKDVLSSAIGRGYVHLLKDGQRVEVPIDDAAVTAAIDNVEWAVRGIVSEDFPMRPSENKCTDCDFVKICKADAEEFRSEERPPEIHVAGDKAFKMVAAFSDFDE